MIADFYQGVHTFGVHTFEGGGVAEQTCYENQKCEFVRPNVIVVPAKLTLTQYCFDI